jgi:hypothetical protein
MSSKGSAELSVTTTGAVDGVLLMQNGQEFAVPNGVGILVNARVVGARVDAPDAAQSQFLTATGHTSGSELTLDDAGSTLSGSTPLVFSAPGGLTLRGTVTGIAGQTIRWSVIYDWVTSTGAA